MIESMYIGSGDISSLLMGKDTDGYLKLWQKFINGEAPHYYAKGSPIDALRTGAILEERYFLTLSDDYFTQVKCTSKEMDVLKCSLDFAKIENAKVVDFDELKSCNFTDFLNFEPFRNDKTDALAFIKKNYKKNYNQVQQQLYVTGLDSANLVFLAVYSYDDEINNNRIIKENEFIKFRISRDEKVIAEIKSRALIFQEVRNHFVK